jgi:hypothetical protein
MAVVLGAALVVAVAIIAVWCCGIVDKPTTNGKKVLIQTK